MKFLILNIFVCRMKRRKTRRRKRRRRKQMNGSANWDLSTNLLVPDKNNHLLGKFSRPIVFVCLDGSDFCQSQGRFFWIFQQILWPVFCLNLFLFGHLDASVKSGPSPNGTFLGHFCWFLVASLGWFEHGSPLENAQHLARWFCSWFLVYDLPGVRGTCLPSICLKKDEVMDSIWKNTRIQKKKQCWLRGVVLRFVLFFRWKITLWWSVVPREDQRLRERGRGMKKERTMWRCRNATRFRTGFCCFRKL